MPHTHKLLSDLDALLVSKPNNIFYITGFSGLSAYEREAYLFVTKNKSYILTSQLYKEQAMAVTRKKVGFEFVEMDSTYPLTVRLNEFKNRLRIDTLGFESDNLTYEEFKKISSEAADFTLIPRLHMVENFRKYKNAKEIEKLKRACAITDSCFSYILSKIQPGTSESDIVWEIESFFRKNGAQSSFPPIVAFGQNSSQPHYASQNSSGLIPHEGSTLVLLDFGAKFEGYCADMTRMVFKGKPETKIINAYNSLQSAQQKAPDLLTTGERSGAKLDQAVRDELATRGFPPYPHSLGHAVGLDIHESPRLSIRRDEILKPGMVFSIEPGIYVEGKWGMRIEDLVLITNNGIELLSHSPKELKII